MIMRRLVVAALCCLMAAQNDVSALRLKGAKDARLQRRGLQLLTRPPVEDEPKTSAPKTSAPKTAAPKTSVPKTSVPNTPKETPAPAATPKRTKKDSNFEMYTWNSADPPKSVHASVSRSKHDAAMEKLKSSKGTTADDNAPESKQKESQNRPPRPASTSGDNTKGSGASKNGGVKGSGSGNSYDSGSSYDGGSDDRSGGKNGSGGGANKNKNKSGGGGANKNKTSVKGAGKDSYNNNKKTKTNNKRGSKKVGSGGRDSYDGGSGDQAGGKNGGNKETSDGGSSGVDNKQGTSSGPVTPPRPSLGQDEPLTGVAVSRFAILYFIDQNEGMPMTSDYEAVHENTYLWLYTIMFQEFGDQMKNLLTDDTSNIYEAGPDRPVTIEYASVALFDVDDPNIPTTEELDALVVSAFTGANGETYVTGIQSLPRSNPFSSTTDVELQSVLPGEGRSIMGRIASRVSSEGMLPPLIAAAAIFVLLAGGATVYRARQSGEDGGKDGKAFDSFSSGGETETTTDELTQSMATVTIKKDQILERGEWDLTMEQESHNRLSAVSEEAMDPDLARFSEFFEGDAHQKPANEEISQCSLEDFVNEVEKNLLGVRIRYPSEQEPSSNDTVVEESNDVESSTALVPAPPSAILSVASSEIVSRTSI